MATYAIVHGYFARILEQLVNYVQYL